MARIRTIKPEFPQSESMGRVSRDARLLFIMLWTLCDDEGKLRGNSRMLASLLFPYDDGEDGHPLTTAADVDGWVRELEREGCIVRYKIEDASYVSVCKWLNHQKIDKPSKSKIPDPSEDSIILANPRESSPLDQGSRIKDQGKEGKGVSDGAAPPIATVPTVVKPKIAKEPAPTSLIWDAYAAAYRHRYRVEPVRNAKVNGQLSQLLQRLGSEEAPQVAAWFLGHNNRWYVQQMHAVNCLLSDCEKLRTEWATGQRVTATTAQQADRLQGTGDMWGRLMEENNTLQGA